MLDTISLNKFYKFFFSLSNYLYITASVFLGLISIQLIIFSILITMGMDVTQYTSIQKILNAVSYIVISVAIFDISKSFIEEEVIRDKELRSSIEARKVLTKFSVIINIALSLEALIFVILLGKAEIEKLLYPCALMLTSGLHIISLAVYQRMSITSENKEKT